MSTTQHTRNATLSDLAAMLKDQHGHKVDVVAPATAIHAEDGMLRIEGTHPVLSEDGVTTTSGIYQPTAVCDEGISGKLGIPLAYVRKMRAERPDLWDANVNGWLHGHPGEEGYWEGAYADSRSFLVRCFGNGEGAGIARALLSDRFKMIDNFDVLAAALDGIGQAGVEVDITQCDLTERRMYVKVSAPQVQALAPVLLEGYVSPFTGESGTANPIVSAGFVISNSEVGCGATTITPQVTVLVCKNGMTVTKDAMRSVHLGGQMDDGLVQWGADTVDKAVELIGLKARDAVRTFLTTDYLEATVRSFERRSGEPVETPAQVQLLTKPLHYSPTMMDSIMTKFMRGGQLTRGGVVHAITAQAQEVTDADLAHQMEAEAVGLLV